MTKKLELKRSSSATFTILDTKDPNYPEDNIGLIPPELANATIELLQAHKFNGDLYWVGDILHELESGIRNHKTQTEEAGFPPFSL